MANVQPILLDLPESPNNSPEIADGFQTDANAVLYHGDCLTGLAAVPDGAIQLVVASPPYNLGKVYENPAHLDTYLKALSPIVDELVRVLSPQGSLCWQVGNYVNKGEIFPLDILYYPFFKRHGLKLRNRIVWHFDHALHASKRFSGRYETLLWFTKTDDYTFNLDPVRVPLQVSRQAALQRRKIRPAQREPPRQKPGGHLENCRARLGDSPLGHSQCQSQPSRKKRSTPANIPLNWWNAAFWALTNEEDWVLDPFSGVASTLLAALMHGRRGMGCEKEAEYVQIGRERIQNLYAGTLRYRPLGKPVFQPTGKEKVAQVPQEWLN